MVMEVVHEDDAGDGGMHCANHHFKNNAAHGGICAFCLQEKLGKLVSSSFPMAVFPSSSSSPSPSFRSDFDSGSGASAGSLRHIASSSHAGADSNEVGSYPRRSSRLPFLMTHRRNKKKNKDKTRSINMANGSSEHSSIVFSRSKSTATPRRGTHFLDESFDSPNKRGFWSFFYSSKNSNPKKNDKPLKDLSLTLNCAVGSGPAGPSRPREHKSDDFVVVEENDESPDAGLGRKVSRSRSVGCGSRSFSGEFFERISTGFGDCTLRRVESQREGKSKVQPPVQRNGDCIKERVRCGGIFSGFMITSSSSSSSSLVSEDHNNHNNNSNNNNNNNKSISVGNSLSHGRSKSWGWALASPMRAFSGKQSSAGRKRDSAKQVTPNLAAIPSLLAVGG